MAFHLGSLGFLTPFKFESYKTEVAKVLEGKHAAAFVGVNIRISSSFVLTCVCALRQCRHHPAQPSEGEGGEGHAAENWTAAEQQRSTAGV